MFAPAAYVRVKLPELSNNFLQTNPGFLLRGFLYPFIERMMYMKKMKFTQKVALLLLFACLFTLFVGCGNSTTPTDPTETDPTDPTTEVPPRLFGGATDFTANLFAKFSGLSRDYSLKIAVSDGKVYVDDIVYEEVNYIDNPGVAFYDAEFYWYREEELSEGILEKINACKKCYLFTFKLHSC